jgi:hypothetical protein
MPRIQPDYTTLKRTALAPMPRANVRMTISEKAGALVTLPRRISHVPAHLIEQPHAPGITTVFSLLDVCSADERLQPQGQSVKPAHRPEV